MRQERADSKRLHRILRRPEFDLEEGLRFWEYIRERILDLLRSLFSVFPAADQFLWVSRIIMIIAFLGLISLFLFLILRYTRRSQEPPDSPVTDLVAEEVVLREPDYYIKLAEEAFDSGELRAACRQYFIAILSALHRTGRISYLPFRTNGEYLRSLWGKPSPQEDVRYFRESVFVYEKVWYGNQTVDPETVRHLQSHCMFFVGQAG
jgi:hypothetical protein